MDRQESVQIKSLESNIIKGLMLTYISSILGSMKKILQMYANVMLGGLSNKKERALSES